MPFLHFVRSQLALIRHDRSPAALHDNRARPRAGGAIQRKTLGPHSPDLLRLLNRLRWEPLHGKFILVCTRRHTEWTLGRVSAVRGEPIDILEDYVFKSRADAEWSVFKLRWERATSLSLDID